MERIHELATLIGQVSEGEGTHATAIPGLYLSKISTTDAPPHIVDQAVFCVVAQGVKSIMLNDECYRYDSSKYLMIALDLPLLGQIVEATPETPMLGVTIELDFNEISQLIMEANLSLLADSRQQRSLFVSPLDDDLLDGLIRMLSLLKKPNQIGVLAPLIRREIFYKLLLSEQSGLLRRMVAKNSQVSRIAAGLEWLKENATRPVRMDELAREVNMGLSTMHAWFKAVTAMSPLQFQKQLRLQKARQMLLAETTDVATVSLSVGYESASQFSREYRRMFGLPPLRDIERLRDAQKRAI
ncbi:AraC family transcriptional regulator [Herpetosiphon giganteus]|uniref:AraC family transcriptional regulator n=1 Tax=Herpetosiphon giganteus TaxID=2029754 RepID=UPI00195A75CF|nr:AraC family transcriptional regulator [Herpetosiphon giganteus]MBM7845841.1 AraC-like DNA-binding protein [Herpetosiphon giganteus]